MVAPQAFLDFVRDHLPQEAFLEMPIPTGDELHEVAMAKISTAGGLDGWPGRGESTLVLIMVRGTFLDA